MKHFWTSNDVFQFFLLHIFVASSRVLHCLRIYTQDKLSIFVLFVFTLLKANMRSQAFETNCLHVFLDPSVAMPEFAHLIRYQINRLKPQSVSTLSALPKIFLPSKSHGFIEIWMSSQRTIRTSAYKEISCELLYQSLRMAFHRFYIHAKKL